MWNKKKPDLNSLKIFSCVAHVKILRPLRKLDNRSRKFIFVGYSPKGYRLWDTERRKIIVSRDVKFEEKSEIVKERNNKNIFVGLDNEEDMQEDQNKEEENVQEELRNENEEEIKIDQSENKEENDAEQIQQLRRSA